ncbi:MAG: hypothetical protein NTW87_35445 [Planctomycetota bacterium]|nr:hypothetical protein [Planctomycetota bacterium]
MRIRGWLALWLVAWCAAAEQAPAKKEPAAPAKSLLAINLNGPADWNSELPFVDVFRLSRQWISQQKGKNWGQGPKLELDANGWIARLESGCHATSPILTVKRAPLGQYTLLYEGEGKIEFWPGDKARIVSSDPGRMVVDLKSPELMVNVMEVNPEKPLRNIRFVMPGCEQTYKDNPFRQGFLDMWGPMSAYRFMDWMETNGSKIVKWSDRPKPEDATCTAKGVPLELMLDLCNRQLIEPWFCMPHQADDDFVRQFATMVRERLDPTLHVYIEYSNEVWNGGFVQHKYAEEKAKELGLGPKERPWEGAGMFHAQRSVEIFKLWEEVFGGKERLVRVIAWQAAGGEYWSDKMVLSFKDAGKNADALAIAPYITMCIPQKGGKGGLDAETVAGWTVEQVLEHAETKALPECIAWMKTQKKVADKYGLRLLAYEGGQHLVGVGGGENNQKMTDLFMAANRHPRMGEIYRKYYDAWKEAGGDLFCVFSSVGGWSKWGSWGLAEYYDDTPEKCPKLKATLDWAAANPLDNAPPAIAGLTDTKAEVGKALALKATVTDDKKTRMAVLVEWRSDNPKAVQFSNPRSPETNVQFSQPGTYTLKLRASDGFARAEAVMAVEAK